MSSFECKVCTVSVEPHPNADRLELARIGGYVSLIPLGKYKNGDKVVYIPEQAVVPEDVLKVLGLEGKLDGKNKDRVKAKKFRGVLSQGLVYPAKEEWEVGKDVTEELKIVKYEPPIPVHLSGEVGSWDYKLKFDIENIKKYSDIIQEGEDVIFTEKIHGTCTIASFIPNSVEDLRKEEMVDGKWAIISKGLAQQQLYFKDVEANKNNLYIKAVNKKIRKALEEEFKDAKEVVTLFGESFGKVQDLRYGFEQDVSFRAFGIKVGEKFLDFDDFEKVCTKNNIPMVPVIYKGKFSQNILEYHTTGRELVSGRSLHIREGLVVYVAKERFDDRIGRVILKSVSGDYLTRKGGTEYN